MEKKFKPLMPIDEVSQNLFIELLKPYKKYDDLPDSMKHLITESQFNCLIFSLSNNSLDKRFTKLFVLVDYINAFTCGSLGSEDARAIEKKVYDVTKAAIEDEDTAVVVLIDRHLNDDTYLECNEGKFLPILHANTEDECKVYGSVGELLEYYYDKSDEEYISSPDEGVWFIYKSNWGEMNITEDMDYSISKSIDKLLDLSYDKTLEDAAEEMEGDCPMYLWNMIHDTATNLSNMEFDPESITLAGVATNICVLSNAIILQTKYPEADMFIVKDGVASYDKDLHNKAIDIMKGLRMKFI
jgi:nicotinamidase-related amidase